MNDVERRSDASLLIIDDELNEIRTLIMGMRHEGFDVVGVSTGKEAMEMLDQRAFDVALIDLMMPGMNGLQLARAIRASHPGVATILMSAYHLSPLQLARAETGAVGFVPKPFRFDELVSFIRAKIGASGSGAAAPARFPVDPSGLQSPFDVPESSC